MRDLEQILIQGECPCSMDLEKLRIQFHKTDDNIYYYFLYIYSTLVCSEINIDLELLRSPDGFEYTSYADLLQLMQPSNIGNTIAQIDIFERALTKDDAKNNFWLYYWGSIIYQDSETRVEYLEKSVSINPYFYLAVMDLVEWMDFEMNAEEIYNLLMPLLDKFKTANLYYSFATVLNNMGEYALAENWFKYSLQIEKTAFAHLGLATLYHYHLNDFVAAEENYGLSLSMEYISQAKIEYGWFLYDTGKVVEAETVFRELVKIENTIDAYCVLISFYIGIRDFDAAISWNDKARSLDDNDYRIDAHSFAIGVLSGVWSELEILNEAERFDFKHRDNPAANEYVKRLII